MQDDALLQRDASHADAVHRRCLVGDTVEPLGGEGEQEGPYMPMSPAARTPSPNAA